MASATTGSYNLGYIQAIFRSFPDAATVSSASVASTGLYSRYIQAIFSLYSGYILAIFRVYSGYILAIFRVYSGYSRAIFRL